MNNVTTLLTLLLLISFTGCVGTVQQATAPQSLEYKNPPTTFSYAGITTARAVGHNKVELEFFPAPGPGIEYYLYINDAAEPILIDPASLLTLPGGAYLYTVLGLRPNQEYKFKLSARDNINGKRSAKENEVYARTFDNVVSDFMGVTKLSLVPGQTDSAIRVDWTIPPMTGVFAPTPTDTVNYEITYISEIGGLANLNNPSYGGTDRRQYYVFPEDYFASPKENPNHEIIENLLPNTTYFVRVRALHMTYMEYFTTKKDIRPIPVNREMNSRVMSIRTAPSTSLFDFNPLGVVLKNAPGELAFDNIDVFWQAGSGSFHNYRVFVKKYDGSSDAADDDLLKESDLIAMTAAKDYKEVSASATSRRIDGLETYAVYQVKVALCKVVNCPISSTDPNAALISELRTIVIKPILAPFSGINHIEPPGKYTERNMVKLRFDPPLLDYGYANKIDFWCVDPNDYSQRVKFDGTAPITANIGNCKNLYLEDLGFDLKTYSVQKVKGIIADGAHQYCFAASPVITGRGDDIAMEPEEMIVRCSYPAVMPPTVAEFPGLQGGCQISGTSAEVKWTEPAGGIYSHYKVFWREKVGSIKFSFPDAVELKAGYSASPDLDASVNNYTLTNLMPGRTYQIGVLAKVDMDAPAADLYSEYNLRVEDCVVPLPVATFKGFTRIFAIGPKNDGRVPNETYGKIPAQSLIPEAINEDGIPYEVPMTALGVPDITAAPATPPGRHLASFTSFSDDFDGVPNAQGFAMSASGIISLAWEEVEMSFSEADTMFTTEQEKTVLRNNRNWGYRVYRSHDNKLTWQELTSSSGLIFSKEFKYRHRPNETEITKRMAFFTDYSVKALEQLNDVERARTYYYRIVPVFDGKNLDFSSPQHHMVKVTLPPANMALVHRWMANRAHCMEYDKPIQIGNNYSCDYNGIGAKPKSVPYRVGDTMLDQGGDLLVDRFELGCRFTRGVATATPENAESNFNPPSSEIRPGHKTVFSNFRGFFTSQSGTETTTPFVGCTGEYSRTRGTGTGDDYPADFSPSYERALQGDCIGNHKENIATRQCVSKDGEFDTVVITAPGAHQDNPTEVADCANTAEPTNYGSKYTGPMAANFVMQSEFMAVFFNTANETGHHPRFEGPSPEGLDQTRTRTRYWESSGSVSSQCSINLASIDGTGYWRPRWASLNDLSGNLEFGAEETYPDLLNATVEEVTQIGDMAFYNEAAVNGVASVSNFRRPDPGTFWNTKRYNKDTKIARVLSSNSAKLPPLGRVTAPIAQKLCQTYSVQTGAGTDLGGFAPEAAPKQKRPLRRPESITASAWPEHFEASEISALENSSTEGSCNSYAKGMRGQVIYKGNVLRNRGVLNNDSLGSTLLTGSSSYNGVATNIETEHTAACVSKYGVQDIVGNLAEVNSERIFCDYSEDRIYFGEVSAGWDEESLVNKGGVTPQFSYFNTNGERDNLGILETFKLKYQENPDGVPERTDLRPWVKISKDSGYCSFVDNNPERRTGLVDIFKDANGFWTSLFLPGGNLNDNLVTKPQLDQKAVNRWRNGDGRFYDFGPQGLAPALNTANNMSLKTSSLNKYFNPVVGFPLQCANGSCNDLMLGHSDNTMISIPAFAANLVSGDGGGEEGEEGASDDKPVIEDFFTGSADITHLGLSDFEAGTASGVYKHPLLKTFRKVTGDNRTPTDSRMIASITVRSPTDYTVVDVEEKRLPDDFPDGEIKYYKLTWDIPRNANFSIRSGGRSNQSPSSTGRYTASIETATIEDSTFIGYGSSQNANGVRCAVMINEDP